MLSREHFNVENVQRLHYKDKFRIRAYENTQITVKRIEKLNFLINFSTMYIFILIFPRRHDGEDYSYLL